MKLENARSRSKQHEQKIGDGSDHRITQKRLRTPRAAALAGILFSLLLGTSIVLVYTSIPEAPLTDADWLAQNRNRVRGTLILEDAHGHELYKIQERIARVRDTMNIDNAAGETAAKVHNALITPLRDRWQIDVPGGQDLSTQGNIVNHEYDIERDRQRVATVSKKWFRVRDSYGVEVTPGEDAALLLAITVVIDMMAHEGR